MYMYLDMYGASVYIQPGVYLCVCVCVCEREREGSGVNNHAI